MSGFCTVRFSAEVDTDVFLFIRALTSLVHPGLAVVPQGGAIVPRLRQYRPQPLCYRSTLATAAAVVVPRFLTVVPHGLAVVPLVRSGSTASHGLVKWITVGFSSLAIKGVSSSSS